MLANCELLEACSAVVFYPDSGNIVRFPAADRNPPSGGENVEKTGIAFPGETDFTCKPVRNTLIILSTPRLSLRH
jgi:hypothetical protein